MAWAWTLGPWPSVARDPRARTLGHWLRAARDPRVTSGRPGQGPMQGTGPLVGPGGQGPKGQDPWSLTSGGRTSHGAVQKDYNVLIKIGSNFGM